MSRIADSRTSFTTSRRQTDGATRRSFAKTRLHQSTTTTDVPIQLAVADQIDDSIVDNTRPERAAVSRDEKHAMNSKSVRKRLPKNSSSVSAPEKASYKDNAGSAKSSSSDSTKCRLRTDSNLSQPPDSSDVDSKKKRLLQQLDWTGITLQKTLKVEYPKSPHHSRHYATRSRKHKSRKGGKKAMTHHMAAAGVEPSQSQTKGQGQYEVCVGSQHFR